MLHVHIYVLVSSGVHGSLYVGVHDEDYGTEQGVLHQQMECF